MSNDTDTAASLEYTDKPFSWRRVAMLAKYLFPGLKKQMIFLPLAAISFTFAYVCFIQMGFESVSLGLVTATGILFYLAPIGLARFDYRSTVAQLPLCAKEKMAFLILYFWVFMGIATSLVPALILSYFSLTMDKVMTGLIGISDFTGNNDPIILMCNVIVSIALQTAVLYGVVTAKGSRQARGMINLAIAYGLLIVLAFVGGTIGVSLDIASHPGPLSSYDFDNDPDLLKNTIKVTTITLTFFASIALGFIIVKLYKRLKYSGF